MNSSAATPVPYLKLSYVVKPLDGGGDLFGWVDCLSLEDGIDTIEGRLKLALDDQVTWSITDRNTNKVIASSAKPLNFVHPTMRLVPKDPEKAPVLALTYEQWVKEDEEAETETLGRVIMRGRNIVNGATWNV